MDVVMAVGADHEGFSASACHEPGPRGWGWSVGVEVGQLADVVDLHLSGCWQSSHLLWRSRVINSLRGCGNPVGMRSMMTAVLCRVRGMPPNRATRGVLPTRWAMAS